MSIPSDTFNYARQWSQTIVETGTHIGLGLLGATYARFENMFTCEIDPDFQAVAHKNMGIQFGKIRYYLGDSAVELTKMLEDADEKCVVLLDAHVMGDDATAGVCPLRNELKALAQADRFDHLVLIDDIDLCGTPRLGGITLEEVVQALSNINPLYQFCRLDGIRPKMLLVAIPKGGPLPRRRHPLYDVDDAGQA